MSDVCLFLVVGRGVELEHVRHGVVGIGFIFGGGGCATVLVLWAVS